MYLFLSTLYTQDDETRILEESKVGLQGAANNYQWGLIRGLAGAAEERICVVNSVPLGSFPRYCKTLFEQKRYVESPEADVYSHGYINLPIIKQLCRSVYAYHSIRRFICHSDEPVTVVVYSLYEPYLKALYRLKRKYKHFQYILVVPDLPGVYGIESKKSLVRLIQRYIGKRAMTLAQRADGYVILTEKMAEPLSIQDKPYVVVEGIYNGQGSQTSLRKKDRKKEEKPMILYTGALSTEVGIDVLLEAFGKLPPDSAKLCLAGAGPYAEELERVCSQNPDIVYLGYRSKNEIDALQHNASVLVNPRSADEEYTQYSFPSKTIEYLATGVPVVMNRLPGIPEEYMKHLFLTERSDAQSLAETLQAVLEMDNQVLSEHGLRAIAFIQNEKNGISQAVKIIDMINNLSN